MLPQNDHTQHRAYLTDRQRLHVREKDPARFCRTTAKASEPPRPSHGPPHRGKNTFPTPEGKIRARQHCKINAQVLHKVPRLLRTTEKQKFYLILLVNTLTQNPLRKPYPAESVHVCISVQHIIIQDHFMPTEAVFLCNYYCTNMQKDTSQLSKKLVLTKPLAEPVDGKGLAQADC